MWKISLTFLDFSFQEIGRMLACWNGAVAFSSDSLDGRRIFQCGFPNTQWDFQGPPILGPLYGKFPIPLP